MNKPFKFRYVNEIVGAFVLVVVLALIAGILLAGHAQEWFEPVHRVGINFPAEGSLGLQKGAAVQILGATVGRVEKIRVNDDGSMHGLLTVKGDFIRFVRTDSWAIVKKTFGIAGDAYVEITQGGADALEPDGSIPAIKDTEIVEVAQQILKQVQEATLPLLQEYTKLAADLRNPEGPLMKLLANLEKITAALDQGEGTAGQLLRDPTVANEVQRTMFQLNESLVQVQKILEDVKAATAHLPSMAQKVGGEVDDLPGTVVQTQQTIREAERLIEGIQNHWLIRKYVPQPKVPELIPAVDAAGP